MLLWAGAMLGLTPNGARLFPETDSFHGLLMHSEQTHGKGSPLILHGQRPHLWCPTAPLRRLVCVVIHKGGSKYWYHLP